MQAKRHYLQVIGLLIVVSAMLSLAVTAPAQNCYTFTPLAYLGGQPPGGANYTWDFEPGKINAHGQIAFGADQTTGGEGVFLMSKGTTSLLARSGDVAPDGAVYGGGFLGENVLNDLGDGAFVFLREPVDWTLVGRNAGLYGYSHLTQKVTPLVLPGDREPGGRKFAGFFYRPSINNLGATAFAGFVPVKNGLALGVYVVDASGNISKVAGPGDPAPGLGTFDYCRNMCINDAGDVAFSGHLKTDPLGGGFWETVLYEKIATSGELRLIAHQGDVAPGGSDKFVIVWGPVLNSLGQIVFIGGLPAKVPGTGHQTDLDSNMAVFLHSEGENIAVAREGDAMPGGGNLATAGFITMDYDMNNHGVISFAATLDNGDTGLYTWSRGALGLVAKTGTVIPGVGKIVALKPPGFIGADWWPWTYSGAKINDRGWIVFQATLKSGRCVLLLATPN